jgi:hypothetical protein
MGGSPPQNLYGAKNMNMISTGAFQTEMDASGKQSELVNKLVTAWEKKNAKVARAGGASLMALSLAACGSDTDTAATTTTTTVVAPVVPTVTAPVAQAFTLTAASDGFTGGDANDTFAATQATLNGNDELIGGAGTDTLTITHTGAKAFSSPAADISGIETIAVRNLTGTTDASNETATVSFQALGAAQTLTIGNVTFTAGTSGATAANVAAAFNNMATAEAESNNADIATANELLVTGGKLTGASVTFANNVSVATAAAALETKLNAAGYDGGDGASATQTVFTATGASFISTNLTDLQAGGTAVTGASAVKTLTISAKTSATKAITFQIDGVAMKTAIVGGDDKTNDASAVAAAINGHFGSTVAVAASAVVTVTTPGNHSISNFAEFGVADASQTLSVTAATTTSALTAAAPTITYVDGGAAVSGYTGTYDMSKFKNATEFVSDRSTGTVSVTNMASGQDLTIVGNGALSNGNTTAAFGATVASVDLNIKDGTKAGDVTVTAAAATAATISSSGDKNTVGVVDIGAGTLKTVTIDAATNLTGTIASQATDQVAASGKLVVKGAASAVTLSAALDNTIVTIDASGLTAGGLSATVGTGAKTITGGAGADAIVLNTGVTTVDVGAGDDTVTTAAVAATAAGAIKGGAGTDILKIAAATEVDSIAEGAVYTGFETLQTAVDVTASRIAGITAVNVDANGGISLSGLSAAAAGALTAKGNVTGDFTVVLGSSAGTSDVVTINATFDDGNALTTTDAATNVSVEDIDIQGIETLNINATTGTAATDSIFDINGSGAPVLTALNIAGSADVSFNSSGAITKAVTVTATSLTGALTFAGNLTSGSSVTTGAGAEVITATATNGTSYSTGAGKDGITVAVAGLAATGSNDNTFDGQDGVDTLTISDTANYVITDNHFTNVSNMEKLTLSAQGDTTITTGAGFSSGFGSAVTITAASLADAKSLIYNGGLYNGDTTMTVTSAGVGNATGENHTMTTGDGNDAVSLTVSSWVGVAGDTSQINISTDEGNDTITLTGYNLAANTSTVAIVLTGGKGADTIKSVSADNGAGATAYVQYVINAGDSLEASFDTIIGFETGDGTNYASGLDFTGTSAVTDFSNNVDQGVIKSHTVATGLVTFDDAANFATALVINSGNLGDVVDYLQANTDNLDTAVFAYDSNGDGTADSSMVFNNNTTDSLVFLQDLTGVDDLIATAATTANDLLIL